MSDQIGFRFDFGMTKILDRLYLGGFANAVNLASSNPNKITHICNCTSEQLQLPRNSFRIIQMDQLDGHEWNVQKLYAAVEWIRSSIVGGHTVLVHCHAGISRSATVAACYLYTCGFDFDKALDQIKALRPVVQPAPAILISAKRAFGIGVNSSSIKA